MDPEQLKQDFLEEIAGPIDLFLQQNRQRMANTTRIKDYNKVELIKHVLTELERVIQHYKATEIPVDYLSKVIDIIKPIVSIGKETELIEIDKILVDIVKKLNQERGMKSLNLPHDEDDVLALKDDLWLTFKEYPVSDYEKLKKALNGRIDTRHQFIVKDKIISHIKKDYVKTDGVTLYDYINDRLREIFDILWEDEFEALALQDLQNRREKEKNKLAGVKESIRAAMLTKLMA